MIRLLTSVKPHWAMTVSTRSPRTTILIGALPTAADDWAKAGFEAASNTPHTSMCFNIDNSLSTMAPELPYDPTMDSLIKPSSLSGLAPDSISLSNVNLSLGSGAARVHILKDISLRVASGEVDTPDGDGGAGASRRWRGGGQRNPFQCPQ